MIGDDPAPVAPVRAATKRNPGETRDKILRAARAEFAQHGFAGARVERILKRARANPRMLYHYFGGKSELYVTVLETALGELRRQELRLDVTHLDPLEGLLQLFDFINDHFEAHPDLVNLLTNENLSMARFMRKSEPIRSMSSPVLAMIEGFIRRGDEAGTLAPGLDALRLYVMMVALSQFHVSNAHTLSVIFGRDLRDGDWRAARRADARRMLAAYLAGGEARAAR